MIISENFKTKCEQLKKVGFTHASSVCSNCKSTVYRHYLPIAEILKTEIGTNKTYGRYGGMTFKRFLLVNPGAKTISCQDVFNFFR